MGKSMHLPKDIVRERSEGLCEKCKEVLTQNVHGVPDGLTARSIHHRQPQRVGGKDSVINMVNLCIGCHRDIHEDEEAAEKDGWIIPDKRFPGNIPFYGWRGWTLPRSDGSISVLDFESGRAVDTAPLRDTTRRKRVATRARPGCRKSRKVPRVA